MGNVPALGFGWDGLGRLNATTLAGVSQTYGYLPSGMRFQLTDSADASKNRRFAHTSGGLLLGEYTGSGTTWNWKRDVIYLGGEAIAEIDGAGIHELHKDHLGSPRVITNGGGAIEGMQAYGPYGEAFSAPYASGYVPLTGYTGHVQTDTTGLIYMRGRFYSPTWHRFINSDQGVDPNSWNQMAYVGGSPFQATDPSGMTEVGQRTLDGNWEWDGFRWVAIGGGGSVAVIDHLAHVNGADVAYPGWMNTMPNVASIAGRSGGNGSQTRQSPKKPDCNDFILKNSSAYNDAATMFRENHALQKLPGMKGYEYGAWAMFGVSGNYLGLDRAWAAGFMATAPWNPNGPPSGARAIVHTHTWEPMPSDDDKRTGTGLDIPIYVLSSGGINKYNPSSKSVTQIAGPGWDKRNPCNTK